jgi:hypothetical protein
MSGISFGLPHEDEPFRPAWEAAPDEMDIDLRPRQNLAGAEHHLFCDARQAPSRLDAVVGAAGESVRAGIIARWRMGKPWAGCHSPMPGPIRSTWRCATSV